MSLFKVLIIILLLCAIYYLIILTFPESYKYTYAKNKISILLLISLIVYIIASIVLYIIDKKHSGVFIDLKVALLLIPIGSVVLFSVNIYYPSLRFLINERDQSIVFIDEFTKVIFDYKYSSIEERENAIQLLQRIKINQKAQFVRMGLAVYIDKLIEQSQGATKKASAVLVDYLENKCIILRQELDDMSLSPFSGISMISSFCLSCILTVLLAYVALL